MLSWGEGTSGKINYYRNGSWNATNISYTHNQWQHLVIRNHFSSASPTIDMWLDSSSQTAIPYRYDSASMVNSIVFAGGDAQYRCMYLDDVSVCPSGEFVTLTIQIQPQGITTVVPAAGENKYTKGAIIALKAEEFVDCPNIYAFDHWTGDVADPYSSTTQIVLDNDKTVSAIFTDNRQCGDQCHPSPVGDITKDCRVNFYDLVYLSQEWLKCSAPECR
jgi:hypothetical protein